MSMAVDIPEDEEEEENEYQEEVKTNRLQYREAYTGYQSLQRLISDLDGESPCPKCTSSHLAYRFRRLQTLSALTRDERRSANSLRWKSLD